MNITKYATIFSMAILVTAVFAVTFSVFVANAQANEGSDFKKNIKIIKFKCNNINVNINGEEIIHTENNGPFCFNNNNNN
ncbi:MAG TPA: hypothetical protein VFV86_03320 [Nitrososphaeraceae archaeon]|nr:hypothetical protein [Nitrososphaeraceae archaeon]